MRKIAIIGMTLAFALALFGCSSGSSDDTAANEADTQTQEAEETEQATEKSEYAIGETWEVPGQWKMTVNSVTETDERDEYSDVEPAAVYIIDYTYENLGYESEVYLNGLYIDPSWGQIVDTGKTMGYSYYVSSIDYNAYPTDVPVGASKNAQVAVGVDNAGDFTFIMSMYDGDDKQQKATFICPVS